MPAIPLVRPSTPPAAAPAKRPDLSVVPRRRRWPAVVLGGFIVVLIVGMLAAAVFHTQLAQRQLEIDRLDRQVAEERERFDELRHERAVLRSPGRLSSEAERLGMVPGDSTDFVEIDSWALARQIAAAGPVDDTVSDVRIVIQPEPLDQFRDVKAVSAGQP